ncbi:MAG: hypothetical protein ACFFDK_19040 [Promethearchaeota archaeon]
MFEKVNTKVETDAIFIEKTVGPPQDPIIIQYHKGMTAYDVARIIAKELSMKENDFHLSLEGITLSSDAIIPPSAELLLIPSSSAGATNAEITPNSQRKGLIQDIAGIFYRETGNEYFNIIESFNRFSEFITGKSVGVLDKNYLTELMDDKLREKEIADKIIDLMYKIQNIDYNQIKDFKGFKDLSQTDGLNKLNQIKQQSLEKCAEYIKSEFLSEFTSKLFEVYYQKAFVDSKKLSIFENFEGITLGLDIILCIENFYGDSDFYGTPKIVNELIIHDSIRSSADRIGLLDQITKAIWKKSYRQLLVDSCRIKQSSDAKLIQELRNRNAKFTEKDIIWITKNKDGEIIWLELGRQNYIRIHQGAGIEHIYQVHTNNQFDKWDLKTPKQQAKFLLELISNKDPLFKDGDLSIYDAGIINGEQRYIAILIADNGFIVEARPYSL